MALNQMTNAATQNHTTRAMNSTANGNGKSPNNTTVRLNGSAVATTLQPTTPKSTLSVSVNVEKMNPSECTVTQELQEL